MNRVIGTRLLSLEAQSLEAQMVDRLVSLLCLGIFSCRGRSFRTKMQPYG